MICEQRVKGFDKGSYPFCLFAGAVLGWRHCFCAPGGSVRRRGPGALPGICSQMESEGSSLFALFVSLISFVLLVLFVCLLGCLP